MTREQTIECIRVMQGYVDGKELEILSPFGKWERATAPRWQWDDTEYRIKPTQWTNGTEILKVKPNGDCTIGNGVDPLVALGQLAKSFMKQQDRIKRLEEQLMDAKNKHAVLVADVVLNEDRAERIKRLEDRIHRASMAFFRDGSDGQVASGILAILEEERNKP